MLTRLTGQGGTLAAGPAAGSNEQESKIRITENAGGRQVDAVAHLPAQGDGIEFQVPGVSTAFDWKVPLPQNVEFDSAASRAAGVDIKMSGHLVEVGSSAYGR